MESVLQGAPGSRVVLHYGGVGAFVRVGGSPSCEICCSLLVGGIWFNTIEVGKVGDKGRYKQSKNWVVRAAIVCEHGGMEV